MFNSKVILCCLFFLFFFNASKASVMFKSLNMNFNNKIQNQKETVCLAQSNCNIFCQKGVIGNIGIDLPYNTSCDSFYLMISDYVGKGNEIISKEWFSKIDENIFIEILEIRRSSFEIIEDETFNSPHFSKTITLILNGLKVQHLTKNVFIGLSKLTHLEILDIPLQLIDENVLYSMRYTLKDLYIENIKESFSLKNLTGSVALLKMNKLSLEGNSFGNLIDENSFTGVKDISILNLMSSGITSLHEHTFDHVNLKLKNIYLHRNKLTTLSARTFLLLLKDGMRIYLDSNPWICDCNLLDLKYLLQSYPTYFPYVPLCTSPVELKDQAIVDSNFCTLSLSTNEKV